MNELIRIDDWRLMLYHVSYVTRPAIARVGS
jgi:hypothetical protein